MSFLHSNDHELSPEEKKVAKMKRDNEERTKRFQNARARTIGIDVDSLNAQVAERQLNILKDAELARLEANRFDEISKVLEVVHQEEKILQQRQKQELIESWDRSESLKQQEEAKLAAKDFCHLKLGVSSMQDFDGEDNNVEDRLYKSRLQQAKWNEEKLAEIAAKKRQENEQADDDFALFKAIEKVQLDQENEEKAMRRAMLQDINRENSELAEQARNTERMRREVSIIEDKKACLPIVDENRENALKEDGRVRNRDAFKGYTPAQVRKILLDNENLKNMKREEEEQKNQMHSLWRVQQQISTKAMEESVQNEMMMREQQKREILASLEKQREEQTAQRSFEKKDRFGVATNDFFGRFGASCR